MDFCYWDAKSKEDVLIIIFNQTITSTIALTALLRLPALVSLSRKEPSVRLNTLLLVHLLALLWGIAQSVVNFYSIGVWLFDLDGPMTAAEMIGYSHTFAIICSFPGFLVQTLFITICYAFCRNLIRSADIRLFPPSSAKFVLVLKIYYFVRLFVRAVIIILIISSADEEVGLYSTIEFISLIVDSGIVNCFLLFALRMFLSRLKQEGFKSLRQQYWLMLGCSVCRILIDSLFLLINPHADDDHLCVSDFNSHIGYSLFYNMAGNALMHFLPLAVILKIYRYDQHRPHEQLYLLHTQQDSFGSTIN